jgi:hypothetical protein
MAVSLKYSVMLIISLLIPSALFAQMDWVGPMANGAIAGQVAESAMDNMGIPKEGDNASASAQNRANPVNIKTTYKLDKSRSQATLNAIVENVRAVSPAEGAKIANLFASVDIMSMIDQALSEKKLSRSNTADAMAVFWISMWQYANSDFSDKPAESYLAVASQVSRSMISNPNFAQLNDQQKQEMAEGMLVQAALMGAAVDGVKGNKQLERQFASAARALAERTGLGVDAITLTAQGFRPKAEKAQ